MIKTPGNAFPAEDASDSDDSKTKSFSSGVKAELIDSGEVTSHSYFCLLSKSVVPP